METLLWMQSVSLENVWIQMEHVPWKSNALLIHAMYHHLLVVPMNLVRQTIAAVAMQYASLQRLLLGMILIWWILPFLKILQVLPRVLVLEVRFQQRTLFRLQPLSLQFLKQQLHPVRLLLAPAKE